MTNGGVRPTVSGSTQIAAVIGDPVRHSLSPSIHNAAFAALELDWVYVALPVEAGQGAAAVEAMRALGIRGLSVTMPHKDAVAAAVDRQTPAVQALGASNCVFWDGEDLVGDNTDGAGFVAALYADGISLDGARVAVLGAGGAARAIIDAVGRSDAEQVLVVNRSAERAQVAAAVSAKAQVGSLGDIVGADIVVNATSVGMGAPHGSRRAEHLPVPVELLNDHHIVADIVYQPLETPLLAVSRERGLRTSGGVGMLIHQAAAAFERWTNHAAPIEAMTAAVSSHLRTVSERQPPRD